MMTLYTFGPKFGLPDPSPFCVKAEVLLQISKLPYRLDHSGFAKAPKGKLPYVSDSGTLVADSTLIRLHLEDRHAVDFDNGLSAAQKGVAWAVEKLCEDHVYWAMVDERWRNDDNFHKGPAHYFDEVPALIRPLIRSRVRRSSLAALKGQGLGRHAPADVARLAERAVQSISDVLGDQPWLMGNRPCGADATVFAFVSSCLSPVFDGPCRSATSGHANLVAYRDRGMKQWYPDFKPRP